MTTLTAAERPAPSASSTFFAAVIFASAALVFLVEPMIAKLVLPLLGGGPSVWNTSLAFFQIALLVGYAYAYALQKLHSVRAQVIVHAVLLVAAMVALPLRVNQLLGPPDSDHPALWLMGVLMVSIGPPFAILSATAPLAQAWYARVVHIEVGRGPYSLYAASNLGSLIALLAYPILVEPLLTLRVQASGWTMGYVAFALVMIALGVTVARARDLTPVQAAVDADAPAPGWMDRLRWVALAAIPSSLMLGVTTHITTDIASAPFLWVAPLALYLLTFVIAFQEKPLIPRDSALLLQGFAVAAAAVTMPFTGGVILLLMVIQLMGFFLTALVCHQALVDRRPAPAHLTQFYFWMSLGGVIGGGFNAFVAPAIFNGVWEFPLILALSVLARPWGKRPYEVWRWPLLGMVVAAALLVGYAAFKGQLLSDAKMNDILLKALLAAMVTGVFMLRDRALLCFAAISLLLVSTFAQDFRTGDIRTWRSFFGVLQISHMDVPALGGQVRMLSHGSTLHGAQAVNAPWRCRPLTYYAPETPVGQVFTSVRTRKPAMAVGAVGLGAGTVAAYVRADDRLTFFEIDPLVVKLATDPNRFTYTTQCAKSPIQYVIGDARLTVAAQPADSYDILLIDAFSSDSVPAHLLTVEAVRNYLQKVKPDGIVVLHLSNRNLDLVNPAMAVAKAAGGAALFQHHNTPDGSPPLWQSAQDALIIGRNAAALQPFVSDRQWVATNPNRARPWTDDYTNLPGALYANLKTNWTWLP